MTPIPTIYPNAPRVSAVTGGGVTWRRVSASTWQAIEAGGVSAEFDAPREGGEKDGE